MARTQSQPHNSAPSAPPGAPNRLIAIGALAAGVRNNMAALIAIVCCNGRGRMVVAVMVGARAMTRLVS